MTSTTRRRFAAALQLLLPVALFAALVVGVSAGAKTLPSEGDWFAEGPVAVAVADEVWASKPRNVWTTADLEAAGWSGCTQLPTSIEQAEDEIADRGFPVAHVVRTPVAERSEEHTSELQSH